MFNHGHDVVDPAQQEHAGESRGSPLVELRPHCMKSIDEAFQMLWAGAVGVRAT